MTFWQSSVLRTARALFICVLAAVGVFPFASAANRPAFRADRLLIVPKADKAADAAELHRKKGRAVAKRFSRVKGVEVVRLRPGEDVFAAAEEYKASGLVESAEPDYFVYKAVAPNDPYYSEGKLAHLNNVNAAAGWDTRRDASGIIVAILDTGARVTHEDLVPNLWRNAREVAGNGVDDDGNGYVDDVHGINSITGSGDPSDDDGHGTHVAGIIGAAGDNGKGVSGVAWNVQLMPLKFIDAKGNGAASDTIECINYAIANGAHVINASFGSTNFLSAVQVALSSARAAGITVVAAAGNESVNNDALPSYPAGYALDNIISVAATADDDSLEFYSNFGATSVDVAAPGGEIWSCGNTNDANYAQMSGTSMAAPVVSGMIALLKAQFPDDSAAKLRERLVATVDALPALSGKMVSGGRVNLQKAFLPYVSAAFTPSVSAGVFPLSVEFTNESVGEIASYSWNFGDGSAVSTEVNPAHEFTADGVFSVTLTVTGPSGTTSTTTRQIAVEANYTFRTVDYEWIDPTAMTRFTLGDNGVTGAQDLPFTFHFFGQPRTQIYIGANGLLGFDSQGMNLSTISDIPTMASPNGVILPYWDNLNPASSGTIHAGVVGTTPNRRYVVSWVGVTRNTSADRMTFQAVLNEGSGEIQFNYLEVNPNSTRGGGARATIGLEAPSGSLAAKYCFNGTPNRVANQQSILFSPTGRQSVRFRAVNMTAGVFSLEIPGQVGQTFVIEGSNNLLEWTEAHRGVVGATGTVAFMDVGASQGNRYFRARLLP
jgi:subtilisin family serine protease